VTVAAPLRAKAEELVIVAKELAVKVVAVLKLIVVPDSESNESPKALEEVNLAMVPVVPEELLLVPHFQIELVLSQVNT